MRPKLITDLLEIATEAVRIKQQIQAPRLRRDVCREVQIKQVGQTERRFISDLGPMFDDQIESAARELRALAGESSAVGSTKDQNDIAFNLAQRIFDPSAWHSELIDRAFPVYAKAMGEGATSQLLLLNREIDVSRLRAVDVSVKVSTATEWLEQEGIEPPPGVSTEFPQWMQDAIETRLSDVFREPFWAAINETTKNDIAAVLLSGLQDGMSIAIMSRKITELFPEDYSRKRAMAVARTESADALNSGRWVSNERVKEDIGPEFPMKNEWLSVLSNTTRDDHALLDGAIENQDGLFNLGGHLIPWPAHTSLPPGQRINCQCTLTVAFGAV